MNRERILTVWGIEILAMFLIIACLLLSGCAKLGVDETSGGGGKWTLETFHPCLGPEVSKPVGGNAGNTLNTSTDGGGVGVDK